MKYFIYWENKNSRKTPYYIEECINKMKIILGNNLIILNNKNINNFVEFIPENLCRIKRMAVKVDYLRIAVLYYNGGCYLDADTIVYKNFPELIERCEKDADLIGVGKNDIITGNALLVAKNARSKSLKIIMEKQEDIIRKKRGKLNWSDIGGNLIRDLSDKINCATFDKIPLVFFGWKNAELFSSMDQEIILKYLTKYTQNKPGGIVLYNNVMRNRFVDNIPDKCLLWYLIRL